MFFISLLLGLFSSFSIWTWILLFIVIYITHFYWKVSRYPKGPIPLPIVGNVLQINPRKLQFEMERLRNIHGDVFTIWMLSEPMVVVCREEAIREAVVTKAGAFMNRPSDFFERIFQTVDNGGIIFANGENWREQRRNTLHILRDFGVGKNLMEQQIHDQLEGLFDFIKRIEDKEAVDLNWPIQVLVANVINNILFGYSYDHDKSDRLMTYTTRLNSILREVFGNIFAMIVQLCPLAIHLPYFGYKVTGQHVEKYKWCIDFVKEDVRNALVNYSKEEEPNCVAQAYYQKMDTNESLNMDNLYNVCTDFFMAGTETTTTTLRWAILYLAEYQEIQEKMRREIAKVVGFSRFPSLKDRPELPFCTAVVHELQRKLNVVGINLQRETSQDVMVAGKLIPRGTSCIPNIFTTLIDERYFPESEKFKPERFLTKEGAINTELVGHMFPFGMGKRQCAGESLARAELFLGIFGLVQRFKLYPQKGKKLNFEPIYGAFLYPQLNLLRIEEVDPKEYF